MKKQKTQIKRQKLIVYFGPEDVMLCHQKDEKQMLKEWFYPLDVRQKCDYIRTTVRGAANVYFGPKADHPNLYGDNITKHNCTPLKACAKEK